jgi:hypothetical protein
MKTKLMAMLLVAGSSLFAETHFSIGVNVGGPRYYAPAPVAAYRPAYPGPGYVWIDGYNDAYGNWIDGYWALPPYAGAYWVGPTFVGGGFRAGYWGGERHFDRDDVRFRESRVNESRGRGGFDRGQGRGVDRGRDFGRGFRR